MKEFTISVYAENRWLRLTVELELTDQVEVYRVRGNDRTITLRCNRPQLLARGLKSKRADWKIIEGKMHNGSALKDIIDALDAFSKQARLPKSKDPRDPKYRD